MTLTASTLLPSRLLRTESSEERVKILTDAFTPKEKLILTSEQESPEEEPMPEVKPPDFIVVVCTAPSPPAALHDECVWRRECV